MLQECAQSETRTSALLLGEPGAGKSRLLERLCSEAANEGFDVLSARAIDLERGRPFGPWLDALNMPPGELVQTAEAGGRAQLLEQLTARVHRAKTGKRGVMLVFDDVQWLDRDSAEVLQHLLQAASQGVLVALLAARAGELPDNPAAVRVVHNLQREHLLHEFELEALSKGELASLLAERQGLDLDRILEASAGNPLYALELARGVDEGRVGATPSLVNLVRERVSRLSETANDLLRWAAVLGFSFDAARLEALSECSALELVAAVEELERHALLRIDTTKSRQRYSFSHDVVREAVYDELSQPRRRLMHRKVALLLQESANDPGTAYEVVRHATLALELELGVRACTSAAQYALRTCANADAEALAKKGLHRAAELGETARVEASLDLLHVLYSARAPERAEAIERVRTLAERALGLGLTKAARMGFQMLSYLRWESSSMADAHANILQAERVSRSADPEERSQALAHPARCLVLLERNLGQAEAFMLEANGVAKRSGHRSAAVAFALAMISAHRGELDAADAAFREAEDLARVAGERLAEFGAMEHRLMLSLNRLLCDAAQPMPVPDDPRALAETLSRLAKRVRPGAEVSIAQALVALTGMLSGAPDASELERAATALRAADAKYELSFVLSRWALYCERSGTFDQAQRVATDALGMARVIGRISEVVVAGVVLARVAQRQGDSVAFAMHRQGLEGVVEADLFRRRPPPTRQSSATGRLAVAGRVNDPQWVARH